MNCPICNSVMSEPVGKLFALPSVTSDCRPWGAGRSVQICSGCGVMRRVTKDGALFERVYDDYKSYPEPYGRTTKILEFVKDKMPEPKKILDVGCGEGHGMKVMAEFFADSEVYGYEPYRDKLRPQRRHDLVTLFHVLEHVEDINEMLDYVKSVLSDDGHALIQVPYTMMWPFDLILADHWWHFNTVSLSKLLEDSGFSVEYIGNDCIKKEITCLARFTNKSKDLYGKSESVKFAEELLKEKNLNAINWLLNYKKFLDTIDEPVAVFGTGPAAVWAGSILGDRVDCYLEDDNSRDRLFNGKIVMNPSVYIEYDKHCVVAPFPDWQLRSIKAKHPELRFL